MTAPNLKDLPEELVSNVSLRLWSDDVQSLRLTCKSLEAKTLHNFATEYFSDKAFIISSASLKVLIEIANSSKFRGSLRRVHILTAYFSDSAFACGRNQCCCGWEPTVRESEAWKFFVQDGQELKTSGRDEEMLTEAFSKLPSLTDITIVDASNAVPLAAHVCMSRKVKRLCGRKFQTPSDSQNNQEYYKVFSHIWSILTSAVANSQKTTLKSFGTNLGKGNNRLCLPLDIWFHDAKIDLLRTVFKNVEGTGLQLTTRLRPNASSSERQNTVKAMPPRVQRFASVFPPMQYLSLDFDGHPTTDHVIFDNFMPKLDLGIMKKLQLHTLVITGQSLMGTFDRLTAVQELCMSFVDLSNGSWIPVLKQLQEMSDHLDHLHLMYLLENGKKAYFLSQPDEDELADQEDAYMFDDFLGAPPEEDLDDDDESDEDLPPFETMDGELVDDNGVISGDAGPAPTSTMTLPTTVGDEETAPPDSTPFAAPPPPPAPKAFEAPKPGSPEYHASIDHKAPGNESYPERGYYVCIRGKEEIAKQLKTFVQEYNIGEDVGAHGGPPPGLMEMGGGAIGIPIPAGGPVGGPPNVNNILNGLAGYLGLPPMPGQNGGGAGAGGHHNGGAGGHGGAAANGNATNGAGGHHTANGTANDGGAVQTNNSQAAGGAAQGGGNLFTNANFADFMMGVPPSGSF